MILISSIIGIIILLSIFLTGILETCVLIASIILSFMIYFVYVCSITESKCFINKNNETQLFIPLKSYKIPFETYKNNGLLQALIILLSPRLPYIYHILGLIIGIILIGIFNKDTNNLKSQTTNMMSKIKLASIRDKEKVNFTHEQKIRSLKKRENNLKEELRSSKENNEKKNKIRNEVLKLLENNHNYSESEMI